MRASIIIVSFNTQKLLRQCLDSVCAQMPSQCEVIVVDNASTDGSVAMIKKHFPQVKLIINTENVGFARANNQAMKGSNADYVWLLNSDTIVQPHTLELLLEFMDTHPKVGVVSPQLRNHDGSIQPQGGALPNLFNLWAWMWFIDDLPYVGSLVNRYHQDSRDFFTRTRHTGWIAGTAMMIRKQVIDQVGLFDPDIFMYAEDVEFCQRVAMSGWHRFAYADTQVTHLAQGSGNSENAILGEYRGLVHIFKKSKSNFALLWLRFILKSGALLRLVIFGIILGRKHVYDIYKKAFSLA